MIYAVHAPVCRRPPVSAHERLRAGPLEDGFDPVGDIERWVLRVVGLGPWVAVNWRWRVNLSRSWLLKLSLRLGGWIAGESASRTRGRRQAFYAMAPLLDWWTSERGDE